MSWSSSCDEYIIVLAGMNVQTHAAAAVAVKAVI